jgi:hypothetical protein
MVLEKDCSHDIKRKTNISEFFFNAVTAIFLKPFPDQLRLIVYVWKYTGGYKVNDRVSVPARLTITRLASNRQACVPYRWRVRGHE